MWSVLHEAAKTWGTPAWTGLDRVTESCYVLTCSGAIHAEWAVCQSYHDVRGLEHAIESLLSPPLHLVNHCLALGLRRLVGQ